jgi:AraC family transcriptional regulator of adaptative response/methylated-DNA-[protein]-cysteine methyltransferase
MNDSSLVDYGRIEKAIGFLQSHFLEQPDLAAAAREVHLSEYHFQRVFTKWAGISPKRFVQFLTVEHAKRQLADSKAVLETAMDSGLSGPGRLHDLFVSVEAVTPGDFKRRGAGLQVEYGFHATRFGSCLLGVTKLGVCWLSFTDGANRESAARDMREYWSGAAFLEKPDATSAVARRIFSGLDAREGGSVGVLLAGTNFQIRVWRALLDIPQGRVVSYEDLGARVGAPRASRAIGAAVGQNPISYLIPCHRVIRKSGALGGYRWGEPRKRAILGWESAQAFPKAA